MSEKYATIIYWSKEDNCFVGLVPELSGCFADGKTREECLANTTDVMNTWLEVAKEHGMEIPEPLNAEEIESLIAI